MLGTLFYRYGGMVNRGLLRELRELRGTTGASGASGAGEAEGAEGAEGVKLSPNSPISPVSPGSSHQRSRSAEEKFSNLLKYYLKKSYGR